jgi:alcohol dehydrogenase class IV
MHAHATHEFGTATRIVFGDGAAMRLSAIAREIADETPRSAGTRVRAMVVTGRSMARHGARLGALDAMGIDVVPFAVAHEPTIDLVSEGVHEARHMGCALVIAIGGGSVIDAGKAIAALATNGGDPLDYLEVIGRGKPLLAASLPFIAVPTTAGTGSEVTKNAVLAVPHEHVKVSLRSERMWPRVALVDPELTWSTPPDVTASTGLDALTQVLEPFVSIAASPLTDPYCRDGMQRASRSLRRAFEHGDDRDARHDMALASLFGGIALANAKLGAVHGLAGPLGGAFESPHGAVCARLLPFVIESNLEALRARAPESPSLARYTEVARILTKREDACAEDAIAWAHEITSALRIPTLREYGMRVSDIDAIAEKSMRSSSMKGNPIVLEKHALASILERAL